MQILMTVLVRSILAINHISVTNPPDGFEYASGSDIIIDYEFISDTITIGYAFKN